MRTQLRTLTLTSALVLTASLTMAPGARAADDPASISSTSSAPVAGAAPADVEELELAKEGPQETQDQTSGADSAVEPAASLGDVTTEAVTAAAAKPTCEKTSCNGKDPKSTRCANDAITLASAKDPWTLVEMRWSAKCQAVWTRGTNLFNYNGGMGNSVALVWYSCADASASCRKGWYMDKMSLYKEGDVSWTNMRNFAAGFYRSCSLGSNMIDAPNWEWCTTAH